MKSLKLILPVVAFLFAIVSAFASDYFVDLAMGKRPSDLVCVQGTLIQPIAKCTTTSSNSRCTVQIIDQSENVIVPAFVDGGSCPTNQELYFHP